MKKLLLSLAILLMSLTSCISGLGDPVKTPVDYIEVIKVVNETFYLEGKQKEDPTPEPPPTITPPGPIDEWELDYISKSIFKAEVIVKNPNFKRNVDHQLEWTIRITETIRSVYWNKKNDERKDVVEEKTTDYENEGNWVQDYAQYMTTYYSIKANGLLHVGKREGFFILANDNGTTGWKLNALLKPPTWTNLTSISVELTCVP